MGDERQYSLALPSFTDFAAAQAAEHLQQSFERVASVRLAFGGLMSQLPFVKQPLPSPTSLHGPDASGAIR